MDYTYITGADGTDQSTTGISHVDYYSACLEGDASCRL